MNTIIVTLIHSFNGYIYESAGQITAFFNDPTQAHACASKIESISHREVEVCGSQLCVWM